MQYCRVEKIVTDSIDISDGEIFTVVNQENSTWAFAMRIGKQFTQTKFQSSKTDKGGVYEAKKQILFCKHYGWSFTGQKTWNNETEDHESEFTCVYCKATSYDITQPCLCRNKTTEDFMEKTESGIILKL